MILLVLVALETDTVASSSTIVQSTVITTLVLLPRAHAQGVKFPSVVVGTKIARSRVLDVSIGRYRRKTGLYALRIFQKGLRVQQIVHFLFCMPVVYRPHPLF